MEDFFIMWPSYNSCLNLKFRTSKMNIMLILGMDNFLSKFLTKATHYETKLSK